MFPFSRKTHLKSTFSEHLANRRQTKVPIKCTDKGKDEMHFISLEGSSSKVPKTALTFSHHRPSVNLLPVSSYFAWKMPPENSLCRTFLICPFSTRMADLCQSALASNHFDKLTGIREHSSPHHPASFLSTKWTNASGNISWRVSKPAITVTVIGLPQQTVELSF